MTSWKPEIYDCKYLYIDIGKLDCNKQQLLLHNIYNKSLIVGFGIVATVNASIANDYIP